MTLSGTSFWTLVRRRVKSWKLIRSRDEILKNFGKWRKTARFYVSVKIVLQHSNKALKLHANLEVIKIFQVMKNFELFQNVIKKNRWNFMKFHSNLIDDRSYISKFWNSQNIHFETQWFSWKEGPFQNWHDIWSENSDFPS